MRYILFFFFFSSRRRHTRLTCDWSSDVCSSDLAVGWRQTNYWLDESTVAPGTATTPSRGLSIASLDTGMRFEREAGDSGRLQTLEPRLLYVHVPFVDQSQL